MILTIDLLAALSYLTPTEREVLLDRVVIGDTLEEISKRMGVTRARISQIEKSAQDKMRYRLRQRHLPPISELLAA